MARLVALVALPIAAHAQSIVAIPGGCVRWFDGTFCFGFKNSAFACCARAATFHDLMAFGWHRLQRLCDTSKQLRTLRHEAVQCGGGPVRPRYCAASFCPLGPPLVLKLRSDAGFVCDTRTERCARTVALASTRRINRSRIPWLARPRAAGRRLRSGLSASRVAQNASGRASTSLPVTARPALLSSRWWTAQYARLLMACPRG